MIVDARELPDGHAIDTDLCIVGGGVAGITIARQLSGRGIRISVLESGGMEPDTGAQGLARGESVGQPYWSLAYARMRQLGGTSNHWCNPLVDNNPGAFFRPLDEIDFERRAWVPESGWPFAKAMLDPFYERAHDVLQIGPYDYGPDVWASPERAIAPPFNTPQLRTAIFQFGRADLFSKVYRDDLAAADDVTVYVHAHALSVRTDEGGRAEAVEVGTLGGRRLVATAREFVIATGGIENARLLQLSTDRQPAGLGNGHDLVGRYFMEHPDFQLGYIDPVAERPMRVAQLYKRQNVRGIDVIGKVGPTEALQRERGLLNTGAMLLPSTNRWHGHLRSGGYDSIRVLRSGLLERDLPSDVLRHAVRAAAAAPVFARHLVSSAVHRARRRFRRPGTARDVVFHLRYMTEQVPNPDSRVTLSRRRDAFGLPRTRLDWRLQREDMESVARIQSVIAEEVQRTGWGRLIPDPIDLDAPVGIRGGYHHMGTTRMHASERKGVVDPDGRVHGTDNLFIAGSSVFPTGGFANPTLTIIALAIRLGDHLERRLTTTASSVESLTVAGTA